MQKAFAKKPRPLTIATDYELLASSSPHPNLGIVPPSELRERTDPETCKCDGCTVLDTPATTLSMPVIAVMAPTATLIKQAR